MVIKQGTGKNGFAVFLVLLFIGLASHSHSLYGLTNVTYYLNIADLAASFVEIPTSNVSIESPTIASSYLAGAAFIYNVNNVKVGTYTATFLSMQTEAGITTSVTNNLSAADETVLIKDRLMVAWSTLTAPINLESDSILNSIVAEYRVMATTSVGLASSLGTRYDLIVSSDSEKIYFNFLRYPRFL